MNDQRNEDINKDEIKQPEENQPNRDPQTESQTPQSESATAESQTAQPESATAESPIAQPEQVSQTDGQTAEAQPSQAEAQPSQAGAQTSGRQEQNASTFSQPDASGVRYYSLGGGKKKERTPKQKMKKGLIIFGCILAVLVVVGIAVSSIDTGISSVTANSYPSDNYIAKLSVEGVISGSGNTDYFGSPIGYQHQWTIDTIDELMTDPNNTGIILFVNSPGGGVYESDEIYFKIKEYRENTGRPVYSAVGTMAASGGYYISAPCDKIIANRNALTGSIGVTMGTIFDFSDFLSRYGIKTNTLVSGPNKAMGSTVDPMTDQQKQIFQSIIDEAYNQFVGIVAEGRRMDVNKVKTIADGRLYTAKQALDLGLIDAIGNFDEAVADMRESYGLQDSEVVDLYDNEYSVWSGIFGKAAQSKFAYKSDVAALLEFAESNSEYPVSYMCEALK